ncbi:hypothetical protein ACK3TF_000802 [Chlorella vulgaris]
MERPDCGTPAQQQRQDQQQQQQQDQQPANPKDCLQCRVIGTGVCVAASAYLAVHNYGQPPAGPVHRAVMLAAAGGFLALGIARAIL